MYLSTDATSDHVDSSAREKSNSENCSLNSAIVVSRSSPPRRRMVCGPTAEGYGTSPLKVTRDHRQRAACQIAEPVGQIGVEALHQRVERKRAILSEHDLAHQKVAQRVSAQHFQNRLARTILPRDFDILLSSNSNQPCATMLFGNGSPPPAETPASTRSESARSLCRSCARRPAKTFRTSRYRPIRSRARSGNWQARQTKRR